MTSRNSGFARRSMGQNPNPKAPPRLTATSATPNRPTPSHIPRPSSSTRRPTGPGGRQVLKSLHNGGGPKRSSSLSRPSSLGRPSLSKQQLTTPRSSSASRTPQSGRYSAINSAKRPSWVGGKVSKDPRPIHDKLWREKQKKRIVEFLRDNNFPVENVRFPPNSSDFRQIFNFLFQYQQPGYVLPQRMETEVPEKMKKIGYPTTISKSICQTLGTTHGYDAVMGIISFLLDKAEIMTNLESNADAIFFACVDEHGFTDNTKAVSDDKIIFYHLCETYAAFNDGADTFDNELETLKQDLLENNFVRSDFIATMEDDMESKKEELKRESELGLFEFNGSKYSKEDLVNVRGQLRDDLVKQKSYLNDYTTYHERLLVKQRDVEAKKEDLQRQLAVLTMKTKELRQACQERNILDNIDELEAVIQAKKSMVDQTNAEMKEIQDRTWNLEMQQSHQQGKLKDICKHFNRLLAEYDITDLQNLDIDNINFDHLNRQLQELQKICVTQEIAAEGELRRLQQELDTMTLHVSKIETERSEAEQRLEGMVAKMKELAERIDAENRTLTDQIQKKSTALLQFKAGASTNLNELTVQHRDIVASVEKGEAELDQKRAEGLQHLERRMKMMNDYKADLVKTRDEMTSDFKRYTENEKANMDEVIAGIDKMFKEVEKAFQEADK